MKGVEYVVDDKGEKKAVVLDLKIHRDIWEDLCDVLKVKERENDHRESLDSVKKKAANRHRSLEEQ